MYTRKFIELAADSLKHPVAVVGLPGIANVGRIAIETLVGELDAELAFQFFSDDFPPQIIVQKGIAAMPKSSVYLYRAAPDEPHDLLFLTGDYQPASSSGAFEYSDFIVREFAALKVEKVFALAAYEQDYGTYFARYPEEPRVFVSANSQNLLDELTKISGVVAIEQGVINGVNGLIPAWAATMYDMDSACLLGETVGIIKMDYRAARRLIFIFNDAIGIVSSADALEEHADRVVEFLEWAKKELEQRDQKTEEEDNRPDRYIG